MSESASVPAERMRSIRNSLIYFIPLIVGSLTPIITLPIFTRILSTSDYGKLALAQAYAILVSGLASFGMPVAYERNFFEYDKKNNAHSASLLFSILCFVLFNHILLIAASAGVLPLLSTHLLNVPNSDWIIIACIAAQNCNVLLHIFLIYYKNNLEAGRYANYTIANSILNLTISLILVAGLGTGVIGIPISQAIAGCAVLAFLILRYTSNLRWRWNWKILKDAIRIGFPLTPKIFVGVINTQFDRYMISLMSSLGSVGVYEIGQRLSRAVFLGLNALQNVYSPGLYRKMFDGDESSKDSIGKYLTPFAYFSIAIAMMAVLFSEEAIRILCHPKFFAAIDITIILSMFYGLLFFNKVAGNQLTYTRNTHLTTILVFVSCTINVGLNIPFIMQWGAVGAAWATLIAGILSGWITFTVAQKKYTLDWNYRQLLAMLTVLYLSGVGMIIMRAVEMDYPIRFLVKLTLIGAYFYLGILIKIFTRGNIRAVTSIFAGSRSIQNGK